MVYFAVEEHAIHIWDKWKLCEAVPGAYDWQLSVIVNGSKRSTNTEGASYFFCTFWFLLRSDPAIACQYFYWWNGKLLQLFTILPHVPLPVKVDDSSTPKFWYGKFIPTLSASCHRQCRIWNFIAYASAKDAYYCLNSIFFLKSLSKFTLHYI